MSDVGELGHPVFDADNHYYEALDAFTRHLDPALGPRVIQWCRDQRPPLPRHRRTGQPGGDQPDLRPGGASRGHVRLLPGQSGRTEPDGVPGPARSRPPRVPRPEARLAASMPRAWPDACSSRPSA